MRSFCPDIVMYVGGPTPKSFAMCRMARLYSTQNENTPKRVLVALRPAIPRMLEGVCARIGADLVLAQSVGAERRFSKIGLRTHFLLTTGVNTEEYTPINHSEKDALRRRYGIEKDSFVALHVGPVRHNRGVDILSRLELHDEICTLIVSSTSSPFDTGLAAELSRSGCLVWHAYFQKMSELFQIADLYIFPTTDPLACVELPLSVLEAMATNLPIVSTRYGALPRVFQEDDDLVYVDSVDEIPDKVRQVKGNRLVSNREKVLPYSWDRVAAGLLVELTDILAD